MARKGLFCYTGVTRPNYCITGCVTVSDRRSQFFSIQKNVESFDLKLPFLGDKHSQ